MTETHSAEATPGPTGTAGERIKQFITRCAVTLSVLLAVATILAWSARWLWILDLLSHFPLQFAATAIVLLAILLGLRQWKAAIVPALVLGACAAQLLPLYLPVRQRSYSGRVVHAISANVHRSNQEYAAVIEYLRTRDPDFFLVMEVDEIWFAELEALHAQYPYRIIQPGPGAFGIALYSRVPIEDHEIIESAAAGVPMIRATLALDDRPLHVIGAHTLPPIRSGNAEKRNGQLQEIADQTAAIPGPTLLMGDLNITPWSPYFGDLLRSGKLRDGRQGFGIQPTWPAYPGLPGLVQIPIDHTLISDDVEVVARRVGPNVGSDHLPVEIEFRIGE